MTDPRVGPSTATVRLRRAAAAGVTLVGVPLLLLYAYGLAWFSPSVTPGERDRLPGAAPGPDHVATWWALLLVAVAVGSLGVALAWVRSGRPGRWWLWPVAALAGLAAGWPLMDRLV